jgi:hypothetical protein
MAAQGATSLAEARKQFTGGEAPPIAAQVCPGADPWTTSMKLSTQHSWFSTADQLIVIGRPGESQRDLDLGLAYGLAHAGDRELVLVLPEGREEPSRRRLPWLDIPVTLWSLGEGGAVQPLTPLSRYEVFAGCDDPLVTAVHSLGDRADWITRLVGWADTEPELVGAHRSSYLAWHCRGRMVLKVRRAGKGLLASAGVHGKDGPGCEAPLSGELDPERFHRLTSAASWAIAERLGGQDTGNAEHLLQERLAEMHASLGLARTVRELPAVRPGGTRAYIDLLAVGNDGDIHVVETKIGPDAMLVLQGLDYVIWAQAHREQLVRYLTDTLRTPPKPSARVVLDLVLAEGTGKLMSPYSSAQLEAIDGSIAWQVHRIEGCDTAVPTITSFGRRRVPEGQPRAADPRFAVRCEPKLISQAGGELVRRVFFEHGAGILPAAQPAYVALQQKALLHTFVDHVRSSQAFALNIFGGLTTEELAAVWGLIEPAVTNVGDVELEWADPFDDLGELQPKRPHQTQVDVLLRGRASDGTRHVALVEVKLSEAAFNSCSAFDAAANDRRDVCRQNGPWGGDPAACFQLRNHDGPARRRYDLHLELGVLHHDGTAGCPFRELNQPMRNVALARALLDRGEADVATVALCAPSGNANVWHQWERSAIVFAEVPDVTFRSLLAEEVFHVLGDERRGVLESRYAGLAPLTG